MNKKLFFDMNSDNTFKHYYDFWYDDDNKEKEWPKWLTLPEHYQSKDDSSALYSFQFLYEYYLSHSR